MSRQCEICGKTPLKAAKVSFSHKQNVHRQAPNLQTMKVCIKGETKRIKLCTSCMKTNRIPKAI